MHTLDEVREFEEESASCNTTNEICSAYNSETAINVLNRKIKSDNSAITLEEPKMVA